MHQAFPVCFKNIFKCVSVSMCVCVCECIAQGGQKKASGPLELVLQVVMRLPVWVLGTRFWSSARAFLTAETSL